jgi:hypothetical protein
MNYIFWNNYRGLFMDLFFLSCRASVYRPIKYYLEHVNVTLYGAASFYGIRFRTLHGIYERKQKILIIFLVQFLTVYDGRIAGSFHLCPALLRIRGHKIDQTGPTGRLWNQTGPTERSWNQTGPTGTSQGYREVTEPDRAYRKVMEPGSTTWRSWNQTGPTGRLRIRTGPT